MKRFFVRTSATAGMLVLAASTVLGQANPKPGLQESHGLTILELHPKPTPSPFPLGKVTQRPNSLEFRAPDQMSAEDRALVGANQQEIARRAALQGFSLRAEGWDYEQAICPVFPQHIVLEYSRNSGVGDVSLFSVLLPRSGAGSGSHVRVIPVVRRSYSLWTPVASNALTINDFNHLVGETPGGLPPDWLTLGLCYAALAGGHVRASLQAAAPSEEHFPLYRPAQLSVSRAGGAEVSFGDAEVAYYGDGKKPVRDWELYFAQNGQLLKVRHRTSQALIARPVAGQAITVQGTPLRESAIQIQVPQQ